MTKTKNRAKCLNCGDIIESKDRHDFVTCRCFQNISDTGIFLDGGKDYQRVGGNLNHCLLYDTKSKTWLKMRTIDDTT